MQECGGGQRSLAYRKKEEEVKKILKSNWKKAVKEKLQEKIEEQAQNEIKQKNGKNWKIWKKRLCQRAEYVKSEENNGNEIEHG